MFPKSQTGAVRKITWKVWYIFWQYTRIFSLRLTPLFISEFVTSLVCRFECNEAMSWFLCTWHILTNIHIITTSVLNSWSQSSVFTSGSEIILLQQKAKIYWKVLLYAEFPEHEMTLPDGLYQVWKMYYPRHSCSSILVV